MHNSLGKVENEQDTFVLRGIVSTKRWCLLCVCFCVTLTHAHCTALWMPLVGPCKSIFQAANMTILLIQQEHHSCKVYSVKPMHPQPSTGFDITRLPTCVERTPNIYKDSDTLSTKQLMWLFLLVGQWQFFEPSFKKFLPSHVLEPPVHQLNGLCHANFTCGGASDPHHQNTNWF